MLAMLFWITEALESVARFRVVRCVFDGIPDLVYHSDGGAPVRIFAVGVGAATPYAVWGGGSWMYVPLSGLIAVALAACFHRTWGKKR